MIQNKNECHLNVLDNKIRDLQGERHISKSHNVLSQRDVETLYASPSLSHINVKSFLARVIFDVTFIAAIKPGKPADLRLSKFSFPKCNASECICIASHIERFDGSVKTQLRGPKMINCKAPKILVSIMNQASGEVNFFQNMKVYIEFFSTVCKSLGKFISAIEYGEFVYKKHFRNQNFVCNNLQKCVLNAFEACGFLEEEVARQMAAHGLRGTPFLCLSRPERRRFCGFG